MAQFRKCLIVSSTALALGLAGCGGGGGHVAFTPAPTPPPTPPASSAPQLVAAVTTSQQFSTKGASYTSPAASDFDLVVSSPSLADNGQLDVRFNAASGSYEIQLPADAAWHTIALAASYPPPNDNLFLYRASAPQDFGLFDHRSNLQYSALLEWFTDTSSGYSAIGTATLAGNVPTAGSASYAGAIIGTSSETHLNPWAALWIPGGIEGSINLSFDFGSGTLSGNINPTLYLDRTYTLPSLNFASTVYSTGSTAFSGTFATAQPGQNSFSGLFTGPNAQELIGNFAFPYASPKDGAMEQAAGAFAGRRP